MREVVSGLTTHAHIHTYSHKYRTISPTSTDLVWETYPECPANNTLVVRDALTAITNVRARARVVRVVHRLPFMALPFRLERTYPNPTIPSPCHQ